MDTGVIHVHENHAECPLEQLICVVGGKWKIIVLWHLTGSPRRFNELRKLMPGVTQKMLTAQLRELERDGFIVRRVFAEVPVRVEYSATPLAVRMRPLLEQMHGWSADHLVGKVTPRRRKASVPRRLTR